jgi:hypothetical protein
MYLPEQAPWLDELRAELLAFPKGLYDDQVDSISQALNWMSRPRCGIADDTPHFWLTRSWAVERPWGYVGNRR